MVVVVEAEEHQSKLAGSLGGTIALLSGAPVIFGHS
jgi:hypothetical protein